jgi:hypothetical protein
VDAGGRTSGPCEAAARDQTGDGGGGGGCRRHNETRHHGDEFVLGCPTIRFATEAAAIVRLSVMDPKF